MKLFKYLFILMVVVMGVVCFSSCSSDDDDDSGTSGNSLLVGTWNNASSDTDQDYEIFVFKADGTGTCQTIDQGSAHSKHTFTYTYNNDKITWIEEDGDSDYWTVLQLTASKLIVEDVDGYVETYNKQ